MKRRDFIAGLGGAVAWSLVAKAQQAAMPVIGYLGTTSNRNGRDLLINVAAFRRGLGQAGYVEGQNVGHRSVSGRLASAAGCTQFNSPVQWGRNGHREWPPGAVPRDSLADDVPDRLRRRLKGVVSLAQQAQNFRERWSARPDSPRLGAAIATIGVCNHPPVSRRALKRRTAVFSMEKKPMRSVKVWAYRELSGTKYFEVLFDDRRRARIDFLEGSTTQQSFLALGGALDSKLGRCCITPMNKLALFDESDALPEERERKLFKNLGFPLHDNWAVDLFAQPRFVQIE
jgi:hypothetical protein